MKYNIKGIRLVMGLAVGAAAMPTVSYAYSWCEFKCDFVSFVSSVACDASGFIADGACVVDYLGLNAPMLDNLQSYAPDVDVDKAGALQFKSVSECWAASTKREDACEQNTEKYEGLCEKACDGE